MTTKLPNLPDEHHYAIANVAVRSAQLDYHIEKVIELALRDQRKTAAFLLRGLSADRLVGLMHAVLLDTFPKEKQPIDKLIALINCVRSERNEILHWLWGRGLFNTTATLLSNRPYRESKLKIKSVADIQRVADDAFVAAQALVEWQNHLALRPRKASREKP